MTTQREQFEAWASKTYGGHLPTERDECGYFDLRTDAVWQAWCASADATREECAKVCDELEEHYSGYKDTALLNGDIELSNASSGEPRACRFLAEHFRALGTQSGKEG